MFSDDDMNTSSNIYQQITSNNSTSIIGIAIGVELNLTNVVNYWIAIESIKNLSPTDNPIAINVSNYARDKTCASMPFRPGTVVFLIMMFYHHYLLVSPRLT